MGQTVSSAWNGVFGEKEYNFLLVGLDAAGKTTILYQLSKNKLGWTEVKSVHNLAFRCNIERAEFIAPDGTPITFTSWDVGGSDKIRPLWRHFYVLKWMIVRHRFRHGNTARSELHRMLSEQELTQCPLLVFANKQDKDSIPRARIPALTQRQIIERLGLEKLRTITHDVDCPQCRKRLAEYEKESESYKRTYRPPAKFNERLELLQTVHEVWTVRRALACRLLQHKLYVIGLPREETSFWIDPEEYIRCPSCKGKGVVPEHTSRGTVWAQHWYVQPCTATTGDGLTEGFMWLIDTLKNKKLVNADNTPQTDLLERWA